MSVTPTASQIEPFFFGPSSRRLFGSYHEPPVWPAREQGVVLCYPHGQEYIRSHRAFHHLAAQIARAGFPALRFDYFGTGDSTGESEEANLDEWLTDVRLAIAELRARSGIGPVILVGLRLGASLALAAAPRTSDLGGLVLWEPVVSGQSYIEELQNQQANIILRFFSQPKDYAPAARPTELLGFALSDAQLTSIEQIDLLQAQIPKGKPVLLVESHGRPELAALHVHLQGSARATHEQVASFTVWTEDVDKGLVPQQVIGAITAWLEKVFV